MRLHRSPLNDTGRARQTAATIGGPGVLDTREAARLLGVTPRAVSELVHAGRLRRRTRKVCWPYYERTDVLALARTLAEDIPA